MTSYWVQWHLKSPSSRLFTQPFIQVQIKENTKAPHHWPTCTKGQYPGKCFHLMTSSCCLVRLNGIHLFMVSITEICLKTTHVKLQLDFFGLNELILKQPLSFSNPYYCCCRAPHISLPNSPWQVELSAEQVDFLLNPIWAVLKNVKFCRLGKLVKKSDTSSPVLQMIPNKHYTVQSSYNQVQHDKHN